MARINFLATLIALLLTFAIVNATLDYDEHRERQDDLRERHAHEDFHNIQRRATSTATAVSTPSPIQSGQVSNCVGWRYAQGSDTCASIVTKFSSIGLTLQKLVQWNPALGTTSNCKITLKYYVCVQVGAAVTTTKSTTKSTTTKSTTKSTTTKSTTTTAKATTTTASGAVTTPTPTQSGQVSNCVGWRYTQGSDTCASIVTKFSSIGLTLQKLVQWNPALGTTSNCKITLKYYVCVQVGTATTTTTSSKTTTSKTTTTTSKVTTTTTKSTTTTTKATTTSATGIVTPSPIQSGQPTNCIGWAYVQSTDTCDSIVSKHSDGPVYLTLINLIRWNPALGTTSSCTPTAKTYVCAQIEPYWIDGVKHQGNAPYGGGSTYSVYRNVKDFGAKGDGVTDDTVAINNAISSGRRCGQGCDSMTTKPALVYFPPGTYMVSHEIIVYYNTHLIGDPRYLPRLQATASFSGWAVILGDPPDGSSSSGYWYGVTNDFYKVVKNFIIDTTLMPASAHGTGVYWNVAQATSLQNIQFYANSGSGTNHQGVYITDGSGGYMSDLTINGGKFGMYMGNQQFTLRNIVINNVDTAIYLIWGWAWNLKSITINSARIGVDITALQGDGSSLNVGSVVVADSSFVNVQIGVLSNKSGSSQPKTANSVILDNLKISNVPLVVGNTGNVHLAGTTGSTMITAWGQGREYSATQQSGTNFSSSITETFARPAGLLDGSGKIFEKAKPDYADASVDDVISARTVGAKGDGTTDDTAALQSAITQAASSGKILFIDYGVYIVTSTLYVPAGSRIYGEVWPVLMASGSTFASASSPQAMLQVGHAGESGNVEISSIVVSSRGQVPGAILIEWNLASTQGGAGLYDVHARVGGATGTNLDGNSCAKNPGSTAIKSGCEGAFMLMHITASASNVLLENCWLWTADHDLDLSAHGQITVFSGRGLLIESDGPVWLYGTAVEHNTLYQYQLVSAQNVYMGLIQTESPYYQSNPPAPAPFSVNTQYNDPDLATVCDGNTTCEKSYGLRILRSSGILVYGGGLYSFFDNYAQTCLSTESCQTYMVSIESSTSIRLYNINTKASTNILTVDNTWSAKQSDNTNTFCQTVAYFFS